MFSRLGVDDVVETTVIPSTIAGTTPVAHVSEPIPKLISDTFGSNSIMYRVANCESGLKQFDNDGNVLRGVVNPKDVGVFQINEHYHGLSAENLGINLHTVEGNISFAKILYDQQGTVPWNWSKKCWG